MNSFQKVFKVIVILSILKNIDCVVPIVGYLGIAAGGLVLSGSKWAYCKKWECCNDKWTNHNVSHLSRAFESELFGQHLVNNIVAKAISAHVSNDNPSKALVMSFHGSTGSGKNHVADIIAKHIYKNGALSKYVHKLISTHHYTDANKLEEYKDELKKFIEEKTRVCERSLFIFDEMDKMPVGLADVIKPYIDHHKLVNGVDYRKNIYVFLSNLAGENINKETLKHFRNGYKRKDITSKHMEKVVSTASFNKIGGFKASDLILSGLIDFFIPFFPLERMHVKQCAERELRKRGKTDIDITAYVLEQIASELQYFPTNEELFSVTGCKLVEKKVALFL